MAAWIAFSIASAYFLFEFVTRVEPSLAAGEIGHFYGLSDAGFGTLASLFFWVYAPMQIVVGLALDRYGARRFVLLGSACCAAGIFLFAATDNVIVGGAARMLTGFGASFAFVAGLWLVNHWFAPERFAVMSGGVNAVGMLGTAIGSVALSTLIAQDGWRTVFMLTGAAGATIFLVALFFLREPPSPAASATTSPAEHIITTLADVLSSGRTWAIAVAGMFYYMPVNVYGGLWGTSELMQDHHFTQVAAQTAVSMIFWGMAAGSIAGGWLSDWLNHRKYIVFAGAILTGLCYAGVLYLPGTEVVESALLLAAGFFGGFQMLTFAMAKEGQPNRQAGTVVAFVNMIEITGAVIFQPLVGYFADLTRGGLHTALATVPICAGLAALIALMLSEYRHPEHRPGARNPQASAAAAMATPTLG
jgi:sugar phosphate permease